MLVILLLLLIALLFLTITLHEKKKLRPTVKPAAEARRTGAFLAFFVCKTWRGIIQNIGNVGARAPIWSDEVATY